MSEWCIPSNVTLNEEIGDCSVLNGYAQQVLLA